MGENIVLGVCVNAGKSTPINQTCEEKCNKNYIKEDGDLQTYAGCIKKCYPKSDCFGKQRVGLKIGDIEKKCEFRKTSTFWGKFAFKLGVDIAKRHTVLDGFATPYNELKGLEDQSNDFILNKGWRVGAMIALTTEPGFGRLNDDSNILIKFTPFAVTIFDSGETEITSSRGDDCAFRVLDFEFLFPFYERNYFMVGTTLYKDDMLWWTSQFPVTSLSLGMFYQFQGASMAKSNRIFDIYDIKQTLQSYTMFGISSHIDMTSYLPSYKVGEFLEQKTPNNDLDRILDCYDVDEAASKFGGRMKFVMAFMLKLSARLFGEQRFSFGALSYAGFLNYYPLWKKVELEGNTTFEIFLGKAMHFYLGLKGRWIKGFDEDNKLFLPDSGYEFLISSGIGFRPSAVF